MPELNPTLTFAQLEQTPKPLSDEFVVRALGDELESAPGQRSYFVKHYLDNVPQDASDVAFASSERAVVGFRSELADFIGTNIKIYAGANIPPDVRASLTAAKDRYVRKLQGDKPEVAAWIHSWRTGSRPRMPHSAYEFYGLTISSAGKKVELTDSGQSFSNLRSNITIQRDGVGQFVHWSSDNYLRARMKGEKTPLTHRIYLNPTAASTIDIFQQVLTVAEQNSLKIKGKVLDRSGEAIDGVSRASSGKPAALRGDGIVLYVGEGEADTLLALVEDIYRANYDVAFKGRKTSKIPKAIGDGVAVGSQPNADSKKVSLTSHRSSAIEAAIAETRQSLGLHLGETVTGARRQLALDAFRRSWDAIAQRSGLDVNNIAFNKR